MTKKYEGPTIVGFPNMHKNTHVYIIKGGLGIAVSLNVSKEIAVLLPETHVRKANQRYTFRLYRKLLGEHITPQMFQCIQGDLLTKCQIHINNAKSMNHSQIASTKQFELDTKDCAKNEIESQLPFKKS